MILHFINFFLSTLTSLYNFFMFNFSLGTLEKLEDGEIDSDPDKKGVVKT